MRNQLFLISIFLNLVWVGSSQALELGLAKKDAGTPGAFLNFAASARSLGMGQAHVAVADDASAPYWNPAGLSQLEQKDIVSLYSPLEEKAGFGFLSYAHPLPHMGTWGIGLVSLSADGFEKRGANTSKLGEAELSEMAFLLSHSKRWARRLSWGSTLKSVRQKVDSQSDDGFGFDTGLMLHMGNHWQAGMSIRNLLAPKIRLKSNEETYPWDVRGGLAFKPSSSFLMALDVSQTEDRSPKFHLGSEWRLKDLIALRAGLNETEVTAGLGVQVGTWELDYAFGYNNAASQVPDQLGASHRFGVHIKFGANIRELEENHVSLKWQKKGKVVLRELQLKMNQSPAPSQAEIRDLLNLTNKIIQKNGYPNPKNLFEVYAYSYFLEKKYQKSVYYFREVMALSGDDRKDLERYFQEALAQMNEEQKKDIIESEYLKIKDYYTRKEHRKIIESCERILLLDPNHKEAQMHLKYANKKITEPVKKLLNKVKKELKTKDYLSSLKHLNQVRALDPENKEAIRLMKVAIQELEKTQPKSSLNQERKSEMKSGLLYSQGLQLYSQGKLNGALMAFKEAIEFDQSNKPAQNAYRRVLLEIRDSNPANTP